jgi:3-dehydroquinate synthase
MIEIPVELGERRYTIGIGHGLARMLPEVLASLRGRRVVVVSSPRIWALHGKKVEKPLRALGPLSHLLVPDGERHKSRKSLDALHDAFLAGGLRRDGLVVAFGGGVITDLAGFAASTYMRGVSWVPVPTTLLAMVDSAVGGKVGINHPKAKNLLGAFHQPAAVVVDPTFLETLPPRELRSGAYEVLKYGIMANRALFRALLKSPRGLVGWSRVEVENAVATSCQIKADVVEKDEREGGLRRVLNLGHTLGHALESVTGYRRFTHGEAVGWGLVGASWISRDRGLISSAGFDAIAGAVDHLGPRPRLSDLRTDALVDAVHKDKKVKDGRVVFVLPTAIGRVVVRSDVGNREIRRALRVMASREALLG